MSSKYTAYPEYKNSGVEWLGEIPKHWDTSKLRYLFDFGKGLSITKEHLQDEGVPCVSYGEIHSKYGFEVDPLKNPLKCVDTKYLESSPNALLKFGDMVFADTSEDIDGSGNFTQLIGDTPTFAGYHTIIARPYDRASNRFFAYLFDSQEFRTQIRHAVKGVKVFSITQAILRGLGVWLPSHQERTNIANFLDHETAKIDTLIEEQKTLIRLLQEKRQAVISHAVTKGLNPDVKQKDSGVEWLGKVPEHWDVLPMQRVLYGIEQGSSPVANNQAPCQGEYGVLKISAVKKGCFIQEEAKTLDSENVFESRFAVKQGDLLLTRANTPSLVGDACFVREEPKTQIMLSDLIYRLNTNPKIHAEYLCFWLQSDFGRLQIELDARGSSMTMAKISQGHIKSWLVALPPLSEQKEIVSALHDKVEAFSQIEQEAFELLEILAERRIALISAAVTGKIDVREWVAPTQKQQKQPEAAPCN